MSDDDQDRITRRQQKYEPSIADEESDLARRIDIISEQIEFVFSVIDKPLPLRDGRQIISSLNELLEMARAHFQHEETIMTKNKFPGIINHKRDHDYLLECLRNYTSSLVDETVPLTTPLGGGLRSWLTYHKKKYDDAYQEFMEHGGRNAGV